jgi:type 1 fimbria pilin
MRNSRIFAAAFTLMLALVVGGSASAATRTVTIRVTGMT